MKSFCDVAIFSFGRDGGLERSTFILSISITLGGYGGPSCNTTKDVYLNGLMSPPGFLCSVPLLLLT